jgi:hypothetical protein
MAMAALLYPYGEFAVPPAASWVDITNSHQLNRRPHQLTVARWGVQRCAAGATSGAGSCDRAHTAVRADLP